MSKPSQSRPRRREILIGMLAGAAGGAWAQASGQPVRIVVPNAVGGITDNMARALADEMQKHLGVTVIVENKPGAAGLIGTRYVQNSTPDGRTLLFASASFVSVPLLQVGAGYDPIKDFAPVAIVGRSPTYLMVNAGVPARTVGELIAYVKALPHGIDAANAGINSAGHLMAMWFAREAGIKINHIPYKGSAETANALISGEVQMQLTSTTEALNAQMKAGRVRPIALMASRRDPVLAPGVPTVKETLPDVAVDGWFGLLVPAATPIDIVTRLNESMKSVSEDAVIRSRFVTASIEMVHTTSAQMAAEMKTSQQRWKSVIDSLGLKPS